MFVVSDEDDVDGLQDVGVALLRSYNYISEEVDGHAAFQAVISVSPSSSGQQASGRFPSGTNHNVRLPSFLLDVRPDPPGGALEGE